MENKHYLLSLSVKIQVNKSLTAAALCSGFILKLPMFGAPADNACFEDSIYWEVSMMTRNRDRNKLNMLHTCSFWLIGLTVYPVIFSKSYLDIFFLKQSDSNCHCSILLELVIYRGL